MTEKREKLIARFQQWLDTDPRPEIIASQCANIAEQYAKEEEEEANKEARESCPYCKSDKIFIMTEYVSSCYVCTKVWTT